MKRNLTCIICPMGCNLSVTLEDGKVLEVSGNSCPRGAEYAKNECTHPVRTVTSTVRSESGIRVPVKTDRPIPKDHVMDCMSVIRSMTVKTPVKPGDVLLEDLYGSRLVATAEVSKQ